MSGEPAPPRDGPRWIPALAWLIVLATAVRVACIVGPELTRPADLSRESPQLASVKAIRDGLDPYSPGTYADVPFTLTVYTPLYFYLVAALPDVQDAPFLVGRLVSLLAMLAAAATLLAVPRRRGASWAPALAIAVFLLVWPVGMHAAVMRIDPLALAFSACCVMLARRRTPRAVMLAALAGLLGVACKQSYVAGPAACLAWLALHDRRLALRFGLCFAGGLALGLGAALLTWGRGFWFSTVVATADPPQFANILEGWMDMLRQPFFVVLCALALVAAAARLRRGGFRAASASLEACYLLATTALATATLVKEGGWYIYFLEVALALAMWLLASWEQTETLASPRGAHLRTAAFGLLAGTAQLELATSGAHWSDISAARPDPLIESGFDEHVRAALQRDGLEHPLVLNLGPPRFAYLVADDVCLNDYYVYNALWSSGRLSPDSLVTAIEEQRFDLVLLTAAMDRPDAPALPTWDRLQRALDSHYQRRGQDLVYSYHVR